MGLIVFVVCVGFPACGTVFSKVGMWSLCGRRPAEESFPRKPQTDDNVGLGVLEWIGCMHGTFGRWFCKSTATGKTTFRVRSLTMGHVYNVKHDKWQQRRFWYTKVTKVPFWSNHGNPSCTPQRMPSLWGLNQPWAAWMVLILGENHETRCVKRTWNCVTSTTAFVGYTLAKFTTS